MSEIILYQYEISPFCDKVRRILSFKNIPYSIRNISLLETQMGKVKKFGPAAKLPALSVNGKIYCDSTEIAYELEKQFPDSPLIPSDQKKQALIHFFEDWADESLYFYELYLRFIRNPREWGIITSQHDHPLFAFASKWIAPRMLAGTVKAQGIGRKSWKSVEQDIHRHCTALTGWLSDQPFLCGDEITLADIAVAGQITCIKGTPEGEAIVSQYNEVLNWLQRTNGHTIK